MTPQALVAALVIALLIVIALVLLARLRGQGATLVFVINERDRANDLAERASAEATRANADVVALRGELAGSRARLEHAGERITELDDELEGYRAGPLVGQRVIVNTPRPDEQSIRGVVTLTLDDGSIVLAAGELLETVRDRDGEHVEAQPLGDVVIARHSWIQRLAPED